MRATECCPLNWQPPSELPIMASIIDSQLSEARRLHVALLALNDRTRQVDYLTLKRIDTVWGEQRANLGTFEEQCGRWKAMKLCDAQSFEIDRLKCQLAQLRWVVDEILSHAKILRRTGIERRPAPAGEAADDVLLQGHLVLPTTGARESFA